MSRPAEHPESVAARWKAFYSGGMKIGGCPLSDFSLRMITRCCGRGTRILDAGCGTGRGIRHLLAMPELCECGVELIGLDFCMDALLLRENGIDRICGDILGMPFVSGCFDIIISRQVLDGYSAREISRISASFSRILKDGGILILDARGPLDTRAEGPAMSAGERRDMRRSYLSRPELIDIFAIFSAEEWEEDFRCRNTAAGKRMVTHNISMLFRKKNASQP